MHRQKQESRAHLATTGICRRLPAYLGFFRLLVGIARPLGCSEPPLNLDAFNKTSMLAWTTDGAVIPLRGATFGTGERYSPPPHVGR